MKIIIGNMRINSSVYVGNKKEEIILDDVGENEIQVNKGEKIYVCTKKTQMKQLRNQILLWPLYWVAAILKCFLGMLERFEENIEPYTFYCEYEVKDKDITEGITIDLKSSEYNKKKDKIILPEVKINKQVQEVKTVPDFLNIKKQALNFHLCVSWLFLFLETLMLIMIVNGFEIWSIARGKILIIFSGIVFAGILFLWAYLIHSDIKKYREIVERMK